MPKPAKKLTNTRSPKGKSAPAITTKPSQSALVHSTTGKVSDAPSKQARVIEILQSAGGTTIAAIMQATGWQQHSVRGFLAGVVRKKLKLKLESNKVDGKRVYRIDGDGSSKASRPQSKRRVA